MDDFDYSVKDGIAYFNDESGMTVEVRNGLYRVSHKGVELASDLDDMDAELMATSNVIIGPNGVEHNDGEMPYSDQLSPVFLDPPLVLYKATSATESTGVPGYMAHELDDIADYLPGGRRGRHYGGARAIKTTITSVERLQRLESIDSANFGYMLILPGTPAVIDLGYNDGILVLQTCQYETVSI